VAGSTVVKDNGAVGATVTGGWAEGITLVEGVVAVLVGRVEGFVERVDEGLACFELETQRWGT
jgi:hypothetical protein